MYDEKDFKILYSKSGCIYTFEHKHVRANFIWLVGEYPEIRGIVDTQGKLQVIYPEIIERNTKPYSADRVLKVLVQKLNKHECNIMINDGKFHNKIINDTYVTYRLSKGLKKLKIINDDNKKSMLFYDNRDKDKLTVEHWNNFLRDWSNYILEILNNSGKLED